MCTKHVPKKTYACGDIEEKDVKFDDCGDQDNHSEACFELSSGRNAKEGLRQVKVHDGGSGDGRGGDNDRYEATITPAHPLLFQLIVSMITNHQTPY